MHESRKSSHADDCHLSAEGGGLAWSREIQGLETSHPVFNPPRAQRHPHSVSHADDEHAGRRPGHGDEVSNLQGHLRDQGAPLRGADDRPHRQGG